MFFWSKKRRRQKLLAESFPQEWQPYLEENVWQYACLVSERRAKLHDCLRIFITEKQWVGCGGMEITDEVRVTIAGQACLLLLGVPGEYCFDHVKSVLVYPSEFTQPPELQNRHWIVDEEQAVLGEAWRSGPVILSWQHVLQEGHCRYDGRNLVLHEFAHQIDALDGEMGGSPPLGYSAEGKHFKHVVEREFLRLEDAVRRRRPTLLDSYGAANRAEFFAVATECFFEQPRPLKQLHPELYEVLAAFYCLDPARWTRQSHLA